MEGKEVVFNAFIDTGADTTIVSNRVVEQIGITGTPEFIGIAGVTRSIKPKGMVCDPIVLRSPATGYRHILYEAINIGMFPRYRAVNFHAMSSTIGVDIPPAVPANNYEIDILIGLDNPECWIMEEHRRYRNFVAIRTALGWTATLIRDALERSTTLPNDAEIIRREREYRDRAQGRASDISRENQSRSFATRFIVGSGQVEGEVEGEVEGQVGIDQFDGNNTLRSSVTDSESTTPNESVANLSLDDKRYFQDDEYYDAACFATSASSTVNMEEVLRKIRVPEVDDGDAYDGTGVKKQKDALLERVFELFARHWAMEGLKGEEENTEGQYTKEEQRCFDAMDASYEVKNGKAYVDPLWKPGQPAPGLNNYGFAQARLRSIHTKLTDKTWKGLDDIFKEYKKADIIEEVEVPVNDRYEEDGLYWAMFPVINKKARPRLSAR